MAHGHDVIGIIIILYINLQACAITVVLKGALMEPKVQIFLFKETDGVIVLLLLFHSVLQL